MEKNSDVLRQNEGKGHPICDASPGDTAGQYYQWFSQGDWRIAMNKVSVRCWKLENYRSGTNKPVELFVTYPEGNNGHDLITCLNCGEIYAVTVAREVYDGPTLAEKVERISCVSCGECLAGNYAYYPETYIADGAQYTYQVDQELPDDEDSLVKDFYEIYE